MPTRDEQVDWVLGPTRAYFEMKLRSIYQKEKALKEELGSLGMERKEIEELLRVARRGVRENGR